MFRVTLEIPYHVMSEPEVGEALRHLAHVIEKTKEKEGSDKGKLADELLSILPEIVSIARNGKDPEFEDEFKDAEAEPLLESERIKDILKKLGVDF